MPPASPVSLARFSPTPALCVCGPPPYRSPSLSGEWASAMIKDQVFIARVYSTLKVVGPCAPPPRAPRLLTGAAEADVVSLKNVA